MKPLALAVAALILAAFPARAGGGLDYPAFVGSDHPLACMYAYFADKTGDHATAVRILTDCVEKRNHPLAMIWLGQMFEEGRGMAASAEKARAYYRRAAETVDPAGYHVLGKYHYGTALCSGVGGPVDLEAGRRMLAAAAALGDDDARAGLKTC